MKKTHLFAIVILFLVLTGRIFGYNIYFTSPTNGQTFGLGSSSSTYPITVGYYSEGTRSGYYYYSRLFTDDGDYSSRNGGTIPQLLYRGHGTYSWRIELWEGNTLGQEFKVAEQSITFYVNYRIYAANNFGSGTIELESSTVSNGSYVLKFIGEGVSVGAIDQNDGYGYYRIWNTNGSNNSNWYRNTTKINGATPRNYSYTVASGDNGVTLKADLKKVCNLEFVSAGGYVYVNNNLYSSPKTAQVVEQNSITAEGQWYYSNGIEYNFNHWTSSGQSYSSPFTATENKTYTAVYVGKPSNSGKYAGCSGNTGDPIVLTWTDNQNTAVNQYQIWRIARHNAVIGSPVLLTTVGRGVQSYTDYDYVRTNGYTDDLIQYDARAYYSTEGTYSDPNYVTSFGRLEASKEKSDKPISSIVEEIPSDYSISNYPNPFNPTTTINYQLPENGFISIKVYDLLGKEIATLVNENKSGGYYHVNFDASKLTSGVYIYTITANNFIQSKKMLLMK